MTKNKNQNGILLSTEDRARMTRLREEVAGRLEEMSLIVAQTLDITFEGPVAVSLPFTESLQSTPVIAHLLSTGQDLPIGGIAGGFIRFEITTNARTQAVGKPCYIDPPGICTFC